MQGAQQIIIIIMRCWISAIIVLAVTGVILPLLWILMDEWGDRWVERIEQWEKMVKKDIKGGARLKYHIGIILGKLTVIFLEYGIRIIGFLDLLGILSDEEEDALE